MHAGCNNFASDYHELSYFKSAVRQPIGVGWTGTPGNLALARWTGWSAGLVGHYIKCCRREWNGGGGLAALS